MEIFIIIKFMVLIGLINTEQNGISFSEKVTDKFKIYKIIYI